MQFCHGEQAVEWVIFGSAARLNEQGGELRALARAPLRPKVRLISGYAFGGTHAATGCTSFCSSNPPKIKRRAMGWGKIIVILQQTPAWRRGGREPERWHWVYTATCFRQDQRGQTAGGRPVISQRGFVATRQGLDDLREQLYAEALRRGLGQAAGALVISDGAVWIWRLADDRFKHARQRLDFYHAVEHLVAVGRALFGEDKVQFKQWLRPLVRQLKNQSSIKVIAQLEEILAGLPAGATAEAVQKEVNYFHEHKDRMDYRAGRRRGEPIGSGAIESTCRQMQCRFKRPGQYWSRQGDESLLCLEIYSRNERWHHLFPHNRQLDPSKN